MKLSILFALALLAVPAAANAADNFTTRDQIRGIGTNIPITPRYQIPEATGGIDPTPPASAMAAVPVNILHEPHVYQVGEAVVPPRHVRRHARHHRSHHSAWHHNRRH